MSNIIDHKQASRYEMNVDGYLAVADYRRDGQKLVITHVETHPPCADRALPPA